jgi:hypothetical protein
MGTRLDLVFTPVPSVSFLEIARSLLPTAAAAAAGSELVMVHFEVAEYANIRILATTVTDATSTLAISDQVAQSLSRLCSPALYEWYSDSLGEAGYAIYEQGSATALVDSPIPGKEPLFPRFQEGFRRAFPAWADLGPEEVLDLFSSFESTAASFVLSKGGVPLEVPEPYVAPLTAPVKPSVFDGEFSWGRAPRQLLRGCVIVYGILGVLGILAVVVWWLIEVLRS